MKRVRRKIAVCLCGALTVGTPGIEARAQRPMSLQADELPVQEQPGVVPDPDEERLPAAFQRQLVFFRTPEPPIR